MERVLLWPTLVTQTAALLAVMILCNAREATLVENQLPYIHVFTEFSRRLNCNIQTVAPLLLKRTQMTQLH